ncbi:MULTISPECIES: matrixin family metalloprotease [unclassified Roseovarius]|uniref:matrixin family metalloprotease n=1 Tax=unclassified Roseovarius TaxID=2614913 RepID=UPI00273D11F7|nr:MULTISPECIES: matrixin family metalloprotease [unclassified Roseovarius]
MPNILGWKWGYPAMGTPGGVVTWSYSEILPEDDGTICACITVGNPGGDPDPWPNDIDREPEILRAFREWSTYGDVEFLKIPDPSESNSRQQPDIRFHFDGTSDDELTVEFIPDASGNGQGGVIQINAAPTYHGPGRAEFYDFDLDLFRGLLLREIGNALGLGTVDSDSVMTDDVTHSELQDDDKLGIRQIYGDQGADPTIYKVNGRAPFSFSNSPDNVIVEGNHLGNRISGGEGTIFGMGGADVLTSYSGDSSVFGGNGADRLYSLGGSDTLDGGNGADRLVSGLGDDALFGGFGRDKLIVLSGDNLLDGGEQFDIADFSNYNGNLSVTLIEAGQDPAAIGGNVVINVEKIFSSNSGGQITGNDAGNTIIGGKSEDTVAGNGGRDFINGKNGNDELDGGADNDTVFGGNGNDLLSGGEGNDKLNGGWHSDTLEGGEGDDILIGGHHADVFVFADGHGHDRIRDFAARNTWEHIDLSGVSTLNSFEDVRDAARNTHWGVVIDTGDDSSIRLDGLRFGHLNADDFVFV